MHTDVVIIDDFMDCAYAAEENHLNVYMVESCNSV